MTDKEKAAILKALREIIYTAALGKDLSKRHYGACLPELEKIIEIAKKQEETLCA